MCAKPLSLVALLIVYAVIVLQDLTYGFTHPCVMDLKMGTSQSTRSQSAAKKKWRSAKVNATTSAKLGVRLGGIRVRAFLHLRLSRVIFCLSRWNLLPR